MRAPGRPFPGSGRPCQRFSPVRNRMSLESRWLPGAGWGLELPCDAPALEAAAHSEGAPPNLALQLQRPGVFISAVVLG